ncbi:MAG: hypothetical protein AAF849_10185 [Bacteroidota bacterium]
MRIFIILISVIYLSNCPAIGQKIDYPADFLNKLDQLSLAFIEPLESDYKDVMVLKNEVQSYDFAIKSRKEKIEIRYIVQPSGDDLLANMPNIQFTRLLTQLASNHETASPMAIHDIARKELEEFFHADWGRLAFFQPKGDFAHWRHAKLLSLFKAEKGMTHILFLFQKPSVDLDNRFYAVQFIEEAFETDSQ